MPVSRNTKRMWLASVSLAGLMLAATAHAANLNIPGGDLGAALDSYMKQTGVSVIVSYSAVKGAQTRGVKGNLSADDALTKLLSGTGFVPRHQDGAVMIVPSSASQLETPMQLAQATPARSAVETVTVTSSKLGGADVQSIPIAITALSQEQLTATQTAGGPDLIKQVPNMSFTKTNFSGYSIQLRGIGTQAISVTTDPAVAVALNDMPFIRNHFFEQEFFDLGQVEVLRGPQGTLYGRNATAGVVNLTTAKPTDQFEAMASAEVGNYHQRRFEGMINLPVVDDRLDIRIAGEWTKRQGYSFNELTDQRIDGRDLWSGRATIGLKPLENLQIYLVWEHFSENDDRIRSGKQLCHTDPGPAELGGMPVTPSGYVFAIQPYLSQGCRASSLYSTEAFEVPNGYSLPYYLGPAYANSVSGVNPYAETVQSKNLRVIQSTIDPSYKVKNDIVELTADYNVTPFLSLTSQTGFNNDFLHSSEDYNRFNSSPGFFKPSNPQPLCAENPGSVLCSDHPYVLDNGAFCDPQLGCSDRLVAQDLVLARSWQLNQEFRLASHFSGPFNFSIGGNYQHYETDENYYVFINSLTLFAATETPVAFDPPPWFPGVSDNHECLLHYSGYGHRDPSLGGGEPEVNACAAIDPNPIGSLNNNGHNYFLSQNPYTLNSYAAFGETYLNVLDDLKLTAGLRWTEDQKHFPLIPSELLATGYGYPSIGVVDQQWDQFTGRFAANWTPKLSFTDQTLVFGSYSHGYKAGGANPPGAVLLIFGAGDIGNPIHPLTFKPEFIDAFELGTKNTLLDGALTLNAGLFYYNYENYQISEIVDRTSINQNFDAHVTGAEVEGTWEPVPGLRFNFAGGWERTSLARGSKAIDLMDRTAGRSDWMVFRPFATQASNCVLPTSVVTELFVRGDDGVGDNRQVLACANAYSLNIDPVTSEPYVSCPQRQYGGDPLSTAPFDNPDCTYAGYNPASAPNEGEGFEKDLSGNELPNAPPLTVSLGVQYTIPLSSDWAATARTDYYWQDYSWARVFNDNPYDRLRGYTNVNLSLILTSQSGWQVMLYDKNIFNTTAITGDFLNSDDSGLTTNVFLTDPKLIGIRVTKNW